MLLASLCQRHATNLVFGLAMRTLHTAGDWPSAIKKLSATLSANPNDQPVDIVLKYMSLVKQPGDAAPAVRLS
eukprot:COSAG02_NODE_4853_length_4900_cov_4.210998_5_plen_73_part_00